MLGVSLVILEDRADNDAGEIDAKSETARRKTSYYYYRYCCCRPLSSESSVRLRTYLRKHNNIIYPAFKSPPTDDTYHARSVVRSTPHIQDDCRDLMLFRAVLLSN